MPIARDLLADGEEVLVDLRPHWVFLFGPLFLTLAAFAAAIAVAVGFPKAPAGIAWVLAAMVGVPAIWLAGRLVRWAGTSLVVTTQRMLLCRGFLRRDLVQLRLQRITEIHSTQTPLERLLGVGRLVVEVEGENQAIAVDDVRRPKSLQRVLNNRLDELGRGGGWDAGPPPAAGVPTRTANAAAPGRATEAPTPPHGVAPARPHPVGPASSAASVPEQLIQLDDLRRRGIVTPAEFEAKKAELLGRL